MAYTKVPLVIIVSWILIAIIGPLLPLQPYEIDLTVMLERPSFQQVLGTDDLGRPVLDRLVLGARLSLIVSATVVVISMLVGVTIGLVSAYIGGALDRVVTRVIDIFLAFPGILLAIALAGILGPGEMNTIIALSVMGWVGFARLTRAQCLSLKEREHVQAAVALGSSSPFIIYRHLLPLVIAPITVEASFALANTVIAEAGLSFLGLGVQPPTASWGSMIRDGVRYMLVAPHMVVAPGLMLCLVVLAANMLGDQLRDRLDQKSFQAQRT